MKIGHTAGVSRLARHWPWMALAASALMLAVAHAFEIFGHFSPCELCLRQRAIYWAAIIVAAVGLAARPMWRRFDPTRALNVVLTLVFLLEAAMAAYHAGVEWKWWPGPLSCTGGAVRVDPAALARLLSGAKIHVVACDQAPWVFLGLSMAGWNALAAAGLTVISAIAVAGSRKGETA